MSILKQTRAFTLVELSIVIVIIGLLVGGVTAGFSLVKQAQLRSVISDIRSYETAVLSFKLQYNAWPGDMKNASSYWGGASDGNKSGKIQINGEDLYVWNHLALAKLIPGSYTGAVSGARYAAGINTPKPSYSGGAWMIANEAPFAYYTTERGNYLTFGKIGTYPNLGIFTAAQAYDMDKKIDDGVGYRGRFHTMRDAGGSSNCMDAAWTAASANYVLTNTAVDCRIFYWLSKN